MKATIIAGFVAGVGVSYAVFKSGISRKMMKREIKKKIDDIL